MGATTGGKKRKLIPKSLPEFSKHLLQTLVPGLVANKFVPHETEKSLKPVRKDPKGRS